MEFSPSGRGFAFTWLNWTKNVIISYQSFIWYVPKMWNELRDCVIHSMTTGIFKTTPSDISMGKNTTAFRPEYPKRDQILRAFHGCFIWESSQERSGPRPLKRQEKSPVNFWWKKDEGLTDEMEIPSKGLLFIPNMKRKEMLVVSRRKKKFKILASRVISLLTAFNRFFCCCCSFYFSGIVVLF